MAITRNVQAYAELRGFGRRVALHFFVEHQDSGRLEARPVEFQRVDDNDVVEPFAQIDLTTAQQLMDELWRCGLRPTEGSGSAGALAATQAHLKDMQAISMKLLERVAEPLPILNARGVGLPPYDPSWVKD